MINIKETRPLIGIEATQCYEWLAANNEVYSKNGMKKCFKECILADVRNAIWTKFKDLNFTNPSDALFFKLRWC